jgi:hypothetical protein
MLTIDGSDRKDEESLASGSLLASKRAHTSAKIQKSGGPPPVNEWVHKHNPKLEHEASEFVFRRSRKGKKEPKIWNRRASNVLENV